MKIERHVGSILAPCQDQLDRAGRYIQVAKVDSA